MSDAPPPSPSDPQSGAPLPLARRLRATKRPLLKESVPPPRDPRSRAAPALRAQRQFAGSTRARASAFTLAFLVLVAIFADVLAADLPLVCRLQGVAYVMPNVTRPPALAGRDNASIARALGPGDFALYPLVRHGPTRSSPSRDDALRGPSITAGHPFGTDARGRDVFARIVHGTRTSLTFGILTALAFIVLGASLGAVAGFFGGVLDSIVTRLVETLAALPTLIMVLVVQAVLPEPSTFTMLLTIAATRWTEVTRIIRAEVILASAQDYVLAARALGASPVRVLVKHILPNVLVPALAAAPFGVAAVLLIEAAIDFLSLGAAASTPSWGEILGEARFQPGAWWLLVFPGLVLFLSLAALNLVGEALRDVLDPRLRDETRALGRTVSG